MGRLAIGLFAATVVVVGAACTVVSGVDGMELRSGAAASSPAPAPTDSGVFDPFAKGDDAGSPDAAPAPAVDSGGSSGSSGGTGTGPATCGSEGSWTSCDPTVSLATCATRCQQQGLTCVESCCAFDSVGDYSAAVGMFYSVIPATECPLKSVSAMGQGGLCTDPTILTAGGAAEVRCCCK